MRLCATVCALSTTHPVSAIEKAMAAYTDMYPGIKFHVGLVAAFTSCKEGTLHVAHRQDLANLTC